MFFYSSCRFFVSMSNLKICCPSSAFTRIIFPFLFFFFGTNTKGSVAQQHCCTHLVPTITRSKIKCSFVRTIEKEKFRAHSFFCKQFAKCFRDWLLSREKKRETVTHCEHRTSHTREPQGKVKLPTEMTYQDFIFLLLTRSSLNFFEK